MMYLMLKRAVAVSLEIVCSANEARRQWKRYVKVLQSNSLMRL